MKYRYTVKCCHKTYRMVITIMHIDDDEPNNLNEEFLNHCIEKDKEKDGLSGLPHSIVKAEFSLDDETWFEMEQ